MADVKDILGVPRAGPSQPDEKAPAPKEKKEKIKRPEGMSREAFALLGGSHPIISSQLASSLKKNDMLKKPKPSTKGIITYQYRPFRNAARTDGLELFHWLKCSKGANGVIREPDDSEYPYAKYNKKVQLYKYNDEEYDSLIRPESGNWTREETDYLYDLCEQFDLRWHVVFDRYEWRWRPSTGGIPGQPPPPRSVEDLKERYYNVARKLLVSRQGREAAVANNTIVKHPFNKQVEQDRKRALAALLARTPQQISEEHAILAEARAIEEKRKAEAMAARRCATHHIALPTRPSGCPGCCGQQRCRNRSPHRGRTDGPRCRGRWRATGFEPHARANVWGHAASRRFRAGPAARHPITLRRGGEALQTEARRISPRRAHAGHGGAAGGSNDRRIQGFQGRGGDPHGAPVPSGAVRPAGHDAQHVRSVACTAIRSHRTARDATQLGEPT
ncbi:hypothetical protein Vretimale_3151 [Volvox reticuliferus]|uniref:Myb-like domain-containing protein n=1 Tax=Volvox reticuliferus TaxID=1737510 RepID=A0A8J4FLK9_9CHLO|nr:hypothetical protein Vretifemale_6593 [Volvox reticuliferus]GIL97487.1 hypothetical protein Vretimale_3151 [Volvox reticuliferus]